MSTIAQQLNIKKFPFYIEDEKGKLIYSEYYSGYWIKREYDSRGNEIYFENSKGYWVKREFDSNGDYIYYINSKGKIKDKRPKPIVELTLENIAKLAGVSVEQIKIKK